MDLPEARTLNQVFQEFASCKRTLSYREWVALQWENTIQVYERFKWRMIPIALRGKTPLRSASNYLSRGAAGPYLSLDDARAWTSKDFNLAVAAGPSNIIWADIDSSELVRKELLSGPVMRTPRGFAIPLKPDDTATERRIHQLQKLGYDFRDDVSYELVPLSVTCMHDHDLRGKKHPGPRGPCMQDGVRHDYRVREWITPLESPLLTFQELWEACA